MDKPGSWFLLAKCLKNTCGRVTFLYLKGHRSSSLLKMSLFHRYFSNVLLVKTYFLVSALVEHCRKWVNISKRAHTSSINVSVLIPDMQNESVERFLYEENTAHQWVYETF